MFKKALLTLLLMAAVSQAAIQELIPDLKSEDLKSQKRALLDVLAACSQASAPDASEEDRKAICLEMCQVLKDNPPVQEVALPVLSNLERIGAEESVPTLEKLLNHDDEHVRDGARRALVANPSDAASQVLGAQLKNRKARSPVETAGLIYALGERQQSGASRLLVGALHSKDSQVFTAAVKALGMLNEDVGIEALMARRVREKGLRLALIDSELLASGRPEVFEQLMNKAETDPLRAAAFMGIVLSGDTSKVSDAISSKNPALQVAVIEAAKQNNDPQLVDEVAGNLNSLPPYNQVKALIVLEFSGNRKYAQWVEPLLQSEDREVRANAANALARIGTDDSVLPLIACGNAEARRALGRLDAEGVDGQLELLAASGDADSRAMAIEALANRARRDLTPTFLVYAAEDNREVASAAAKAMARVGDDSNIKAMVQLMMVKEDAPVSRDLLTGIVEIMRRSLDASAAVLVLVADMDGARPRSQANILKVLAESGSPDALDPLVNACRSSDEQLQKTAIKALGGWQDVNGIPAMLGLAADESLSLTNHVILMRGVSRIYAAKKPNEVSKVDLQKALDTCRRQEERDALQTTYDKARG